MSCDRYHQITFITSFFGSDRYVARSKTIIVRSKVAISYAIYRMSVYRSDRTEREIERDRDREIKARETHVHVSAVRHTSHVSLSGREAGIDT